MPLGATAVRRISFVSLAFVLSGATCSFDGGGTGEVTQTQPTSTTPTTGTNTGNGEGPGTTPAPRADPNEGTIGELGAVVTIEPGDVTLTRGEIFRFQARVTFPQTSGLTDQGVLWDIKPGPSGERGGTINQDGEYTAPDTAGTYYVVARSVADPAATGVAKVLVKRIGISLTPRSARVNPGSTQQFMASVIGTTNTAFAWSVVEGTLSAGAIRSSGVYTAPFGTGVFHVRASAVEDPTVQATATVYVNTDPYISVTICPAETTLVPNESINFSASVLNPADPGDMAVEWEFVPIAGQSTGGAALTGSTLTAGPADGTFEVHARSVTDPSKVARATVRVGTPSTPVLRGWVNYPRASGPTRIYVGGEGWSTGTTTLLEPGIFKIRGAAASTAPERALFAWVDVEGTQRFVPSINPSGRVVYGTKGNDDFVTLTIDNDPLAPPTTLNAPVIMNAYGMDKAISFKWKRVLDTGGRERATSYEIQIATDNNFSTESLVAAASLSAGLEPRFIKRGLANGVQYFFRVRARAGANDVSDWSTPLPPALPDSRTPAAGSGTEAVNGHIDIRRVRQTVNATNIIVLTRPLAGGNETLATTTVNASDTDLIDYTLPHLAAETAYQIEVFTDVDEDGRIEPLEPSIPHERIVKTGATGVDIDNVDFAFTGESMTLGWVELDATGQYSVMAATGSGTRQVVGGSLVRTSVGNFSGPSVPIDLQLAPEGGYFFSLLQLGTTAPAAGAELVFNTAFDDGQTCATTAPVTGIVGQPQILSATSALAPTVSWTAPASTNPVALYEVSVTQAADQSSGHEWRVPSSVTSVTVPSSAPLTATTAYILRVTAFDAYRNNGTATMTFTTPAQ